MSKKERKEIGIAIILWMSIIALFFSVGKIVKVQGAELGAGGGSGYPAVLDTDSSVELSTTVARADVSNDLAEAIVNVQTELGTDPAGSMTDAKTRLAVSLEDDGTLKADIVGDAEVDWGIGANQIASVKDAPLAKAYLSADQDNLVDGTWTKVLLDTESYDIGSDFDVAGSSFTADTTGYYHISAQVEFENTDLVADKRYSIQARKNAGDIFHAYSHASSVNVLTANGSDIVYLEVNDTVTLWGRSDSGDNAVDINSGDATTFLTIRLVQR